MFFTQEDYRKIERWLQANSKKDTDFSEAITPLNGNETIAFVQNNHNVKASVKDIVDQLFLLGVSDFLNVTDKYNESYISLTQAIQLIPYKSRKIGQVITFLNEEGKWVLYQFQGKLIQWNNTTLWVDLIQKISGNTIVPDQEDLTSFKRDTETVFKFKDKTYNEADYSGLGRVYVRKNIQKVTDPSTGLLITTNLLTQDMIKYENTIYHIQYDYSLNGQTIIIPEGCVLQFEGGSLKNGIIVGNSVKIVSDNNIFKDNLTISNIFENTSKLSWFCSSEDSTKIITESFNRCVLSATNILIDFDIYIDSPIDITYKNITGIKKYNYGSVDLSKNTFIKPSSNFTPIIIDGNTVNSLLYIQEIVRNVSITNIHLDGDFKVKYGLSQIDSVRSATGIHLIGCTLTKFIVSAIKLISTEMCIISDCFISHNYCGILANGGAIIEENLTNLDSPTRAVNLLKIQNSYLVYNNYGIIINAISDFVIDNTAVSHSSLWGIYASTNYEGVISNCYFEGNGSGRTWVSDKGFYTATSTNNIFITKEWGELFSDIKNYYVRACIYLKRGNVSIDNPYISVKSVRISNTLLSNTIQDGIDSLVCLGNGATLTIKNTSYYKDTRDPITPGNDNPKYLTTLTGSVSNVYSINNPTIFSYKHFSNISISKYTPTCGYFDLINIKPINVNVDNYAGVLSLDRYRYNSLKYGIPLIEFASSNAITFNLDINKFLYNSYVLIPVSDKENNSISNLTIEMYIVKDNITKLYRSSNNNQLSLYNNVIFAKLHVDKEDLINVTSCFINLKDATPNTSILFGCPLITFNNRVEPYINMLTNSQGFDSRGNTNSRPKLSGILNTSGLTYYDSEYSNLIVWNGVEWVNSDGTLTSKVSIV